MQVKTITRYHTSYPLGWLVGMKTIKKTDNNNCRRKHGENGTLTHRKVNCGGHFGKQSGSSSKRSNIELSYNPYFMLGIYPEKWKHVHAKTCTWVFTAVFLIITKRQKLPKCPSADKWINECGICRMFERLSHLNNGISLKVISHITQS